MNIGIYECQASITRQLFRIPLNKSESKLFHEYPPHNSIVYRRFTLNVIGKIYIYIYIVFYTKDTNFSVRTMISPLCGVWFAYFGMFNVELRHERN